jgi:hypothetical protein
MQPISAIAKTLALVSICLSLPVAQAKEPSSPALQLQEQLGSDLLSAKPSAMEEAVKKCVQQSPKQCHRFAPAALSSGRADANAIAPSLVVASIQALGKTLSDRQLADIIYSAVKATPDAVLPIVEASAHVVPQALVQTIVSSAISAVPDPYKMVKFSRKKPASGPSSKTSSGKGEELRDFKNPASEEANETLAQAIVDACAIASGVNGLTTLGNLDIMGANVTSPNGNFGDANYGNEPRVEAPSIPVVSH